MPRTNISQDHEGSRALVPAFADIRTVAAGTNGMQVLLPHQVFYPRIVFTPRPFHLHPVGQPGTYGIVVFQNLFLAKIGREWECQITTDALIFCVSSSLAFCFEPRSGII